MLSEKRHHAEQYLLTIQTVTLTQESIKGTGRPASLMTADAIGRKNKKMRVMGPIKGDFSICTILYFKIHTNIHTYVSESLNKCNKLIVIMIRWQEYGFYYYLYFSRF